MARYTKQIRKRRQRTKKLKNARRTKRYKIKRGGLGPHDHENIGINTRWSFQDGGVPGIRHEDTDQRSKADKIRDFEIYIFGSGEHAELWKQIMTACKVKVDKENGDNEKINFYVLTAGIKVIIIRILQLLELDHLVEEVLCVNPDIKGNPTNRGDKTNRNSFKRQIKYDVIRNIMEELYGPSICRYKNISGAFIDDDLHHGTTKEYCLTIDFIHAIGAVDPGLNKGNTYRMICEDKAPEVSKKIYESPHIVNTAILRSLLTNINSSYSSCVFSDFDRTLSVNNGVLPFLNPEFKEAFFQKFNVIETPIPAPAPDPPSEE
jgi:hypothetical protein